MAKPGAKFFFLVISVLSLSAVVKIFIQIYKYELRLLQDNMRGKLVRFSNPINPLITTSALYACHNNNISSLLQFLSLVSLQGADIERGSLGRLESEPDGFLFALSGADTATHAFLKINGRQSVNRFYGIKLAEVRAQSAADAERLVNF